MENILENWKKYLTEEQISYTMVIALKAEPDTQLYGSVFEKIRAIEGITVIKTAQAMEKDNHGNKFFKLDIRFMMDRGRGVEYLDKVKNAIRKLKDDQGDRILSVVITRMPEKLS